jgi:hypothetical protein
MAAVPDEDVGAADATSEPTKIHTARQAPCTLVRSFAGSFAAISGKEIRNLKWLRLVILQAKADWGKQSGIIRRIV